MLVPSGRRGAGAGVGRRPSRSHRSHPGRVSPGDPQDPEAPVPARSLVVPGRCKGEGRSRRGDIWSSHKTPGHRSAEETLEDGPSARKWVRGSCDEPRVLCRSVRSQSCLWTVDRGPGQSRKCIHRSPVTTRQVLFPPLPGQTGRGVGPPALGSRVGPCRERSRRRGVTVRVWVDDVPRGPGGCGWERSDTSFVSGPPVVHSVRATECGPWGR